MHSTQEKNIIKSAGKRDFDAKKNQTDVGCWKNETLGTQVLVNRMVGQNTLLLYGKKTAFFLFFKC